NDEGMCYYAGADAARLVDRTGATQPEHGGQERPSPVGKAAEAQVEQTEDDRRNHQRDRPAPLPVLERLPQDAEDQELLGERYHPQEPDQGAGNAPPGSGSPEADRVQREGERQSDRQEIEVMNGADAPFAPGRNEAEAGLADAAAHHQDDHRHLDLGEVAEEDDLPPDLG